MQSHTNITKPFDRKNLIDFFPTTMEKNIFSAKNYHKFVPLEVFRVNMRSAFEDALQRAYPVPIDWDLDWGTMVEDTGEGHNFFDINRKAIAHGLKVGESYIDTKEGIVSSRDRNEEKERRKRLIISFRTFLIDNVKSTKWSMQYTVEPKGDDKYSAKGIRNTANGYRNTAIVDVATLGVTHELEKGTKNAYKYAKKVEKIKPKLGKVMKGAIGHHKINTGLPSSLSSSVFSPNPKISVLEVGEGFGVDKTMEKVFPGDGIDVGLFDNELIRNVNHKLNKALLHPLVKMVAGSEMADKAVSLKNEYDDIRQSVAEFVANVFLPCLAPCEAAVSVPLNLMVWNKYNKVANYAAEREEESDEAWSKLWCDFIIEDIEGMTNNDLCELGKMLNIQMQNYEWLKD